VLQLHHGVNRIAKRLAIHAAAKLPSGVKAFLHRHRHLDRISRLWFRALLGSGEVTIEAGPLCGWRLASSEHISHAHVRGVYEREVQEAIARIVKPGWICYDLGASIGYLSLVMVKAGARRVYAFEPAPHAAEEIRRNFQANGVDNYTIVANPVSDSIRPVRFGITDVAYGSAIAYSPTRWPTIEVMTVTLEAFVKEHEFPDFVKIDVEGEEEKVLEGARSILAERRTIFCIEVHTFEDAVQTKRILEEYGYRVTSLSGEEFVISSEIKAGNVQVLAWPAEVRRS